MSLLKNNKSLLIIKTIAILIAIICLASCKKTSIDKTLKESVIDKESIKKIENDSVVRETDFFNDTSNNGVFINFVAHFGVNNSNFENDDSLKLQNAIDSVHNLGGGSLLIPEGKYTFAEINLKSNVHLKISDKAVIRPPKYLKEQYAIFKVTNSNSSIPLKNVGIIGVGGGNFTVDLRHTKNKYVRVIQSWNVKNFKYSNMLVEDDYSQFAALEFNGVKIKDSVYGPTYGVVKNIKVNNADYGYGAVQLQLGSNIYFNNLDGIGGTTLRIETHNLVLREIGTYQPSTNIYGRNIRSEKGNSALMLSPHFINNGFVDIRNITSLGSGFAVRVENGFTTKEEKALGLTAGIFDPKSIIRNVTATYASSNAQLKPKHYKYMPCSLRPLIGTDPIPPNNKSYFGPSIAGLVDNANYKIDVSEDDVKGIGFIEGWNYVDDSDIVAIGNCR